MKSDILGFERSSRKFSKNISISGPIFDKKIHFDGHNEDIVEPYYWHLNFAYFVARQFTQLKLEDYHYFSENSQFGTQMRQIKGGAIKAFQENLSQLVQLVKVHLMPLLKEVKQAEFYNSWFKQIVENDDKIQKEMQKSNSSRDVDSLKKWRRARDEAINHIKDKWVNEVDGGRLWQINRPASEQGLDFALLPQLFFGVNLEKPLDTDSLSEQLESDIYTIDVSNMAKEQVARFLYRFHTWLPTAIKESTVTYRIKISSLKQFYSQIQMHMSFMKPLLLEVARKSEDLESSNFYKGFDMENPQFVNLFDYSYWYVKLLFIRDFNSKGFDLNDLEFTRYGLYLRDKKGDHAIGFGNHKGKPGFIFGEEVVEGETHYMFLPYSGDLDELNMDKYKEMLEEWNKNKIYLHKKDLRAFPVLGFDFSQKRRMEVLKSPQGSQQMPYMQNEILYKGYSWNIYEIASFRDSLKVENLQLLETFIEEISSIKDDLLKYVNDLEGHEALKIYEESNYSKKKDNNKKSSSDLALDPIRGLGSLFSPLLPDFEKGYRDRKSFQSNDSSRDKHHESIRINTLEDAWKGYTVFKKAHGFIQY